MTNSSRQAGPLRDRSFEVAVPGDLLTSVQAGTSKTRYKNRRFAKNPFDLVIYLQLLERLKPRTIIEIGTSEGGSAIWFRDQCRSLELDCRVLTMDHKPLANPIEDVSFFKVDAMNPSDTFPHTEISSSLRPWLVVEDSAHLYDSCRSVLDYFHPLLEVGDYMVVEDGVVADLPDPIYSHYEDGPNRAVSDHLSKWPTEYEIDTGLCDFYGHNVTYCPNAWLVRV